VAISGNLTQCPEPSADARQSLLLDAFADDSIDGKSQSCLRSQEVTDDASSDAAVGVGGCTLRFWATACLFVSLLSSILEWA